MNKKKLFLIALAVILVGTIFQAGFAAEQKVSNETKISNEEIVISKHVLEKIKVYDSNNYDRNLNNYKSLLTTLNVHLEFKEEIETLILADYPLPDLLIAYEYLYQQFGLIEELESLVAKKRAGGSWKSILEEYQKIDKDFIPRAFESDYLEKLIQTIGLTTDDIMIADRISFISGQQFEDVINTKLKAGNWKEVNVKLGILYSQDILPRVQITSEQLLKYTQYLDEQQVVGAFVLGHKLGKDAEYIIEKMIAGNSEADIFAEISIEKYY